MENEEAILKGEFSVSLLDKSKYKAQISDIIDLSVEKIYQSKEVVEKEIAGFKILSDLLEVYTGALVRTKEDKASNYDKLLLRTLPSAIRSTSGSYYELLLNASTYVASLSDSGAVDIHNKISGKQL